MLFADLKLKPASLQAIEELGFTEPTEIQEKSIPILLEQDTDFVGQAQTGTGKTAAFVFPLLEKINFKSNKIQAIILAPTRELANQICDEVKKLSKHHPVKTLSIYGGTSVAKQMGDLKKKTPQILVGTPGRTLDFLRRKLLKLDDCRYVILDEADEMLDMGFFEDVTEIVSSVENKKTWMFSATMPKPILNMINKEFIEPQIVKVTKKILTSARVKQQFCLVRSRDHAEALCRYLDFFQDSYAIVFTKTKVQAKELTDLLNERGFQADSLHGDMSQDQRDLTMKKFKQKRVNLLVCTDVAARGIDVDNLTHVVNYGLPQDNESYVHRIGRTGRGSSEGIALSLVDPRDRRRLRDIERITQAKIDEVNLPTVTDIMDIMAKKAYSKFALGMEKHLEEDDQYQKFLAEFKNCPKEELLKGIYSHVFEENFKKYSKARPLDTSSAGSSDRAGGADRGRRTRGQTQSGYKKYTINLGKNHGLEPGKLINFIAKGSSIRGSEIGRISIERNLSFFEVPERFESKILQLNQSTYANRSIDIGQAKEAAQGAGAPARRSRRRTGPRAPR